MRTHTRWMRALVFVIAGAAVAACSDDRGLDTLAAPTAESGTLAVSLSSPFDNDGAVSFELRGEGITDVTGVAGTEIFTSEETGRIKVAVVGAALSGDIITFRVPDVTLVEQYRASLVEVADDRNEVRRELTGYTVEVTRTN